LKARVTPPEPELEVERYELREGPAYQFTWRRREFFKALGCGLVVLLVVKPTFAQESGGGGRRGGGRNRPQEIGAWLHIGEDGTVTVFTGKAEVGQNIRTSLSQVVAEELHVPLGSIRLVMADTKLVPFDAGTFGSRTTPDMAVQLRRTSAAAREALLDLAAETWKTERTKVSLSEGKVTNATGNETLTFGQLTKGQKLMKTVTGELATTPPDKWRVTGMTFAKVDGRAFVTGRHQYASDIQRPAMARGKVLRPVALGAKLQSLDSKRAEAMPGVTVVHDGDFVGVTAPDEFTANQALAALHAEWTTTEQPSDKELFELLKKQGNEGGRREGGRGGGGGGGQAGSIEEGLAAAEHKLQATYTVAYIAHAPLEPRCAVAEWQGDDLTVWTGTQRPFGVRGDLAQAFHIAEERVRVIVPDTGSGYGGKHTGEAALEAARLAKAAGKPVKLVWTREEEFAWAYFRPAGVIEVNSGVKKDGTLTAWDFHNYNSGGSALRTLYSVPNQRHEFHSARSPLRQGSYRALAATANHFARESHMDELAHAVGMDPLEFRLKNLKDARLRAVLEAAATTFGWGKTKPAPGHGVGLAGGSEKGSYVATCAEVSVDADTGRIRVIRVAQAFECGAVLNPDHLKNQNEGAIIMGMGGALTEAIRFEKGKITNARFSEYRVPHFSDMPSIEIKLLDRKDLASLGAGETPIVTIAPAVANGVFAATGKRLRSMPMRMSDAPA
jgi:isoquinoline 1-oxidoreductase